MSGVSYNNNSSSGSGTYSMLPTSSLPRSTVLLSRPLHACRCETCTLDVRESMELSIYEPVEPLMIPMLGPSFGWWNVRLPSKLLEPAVPLNNADYIAIDEEVMSFLEEKKVLNWCAGLRQLHPIQTTGDGNCLMHAVILATCGIQDSGLVLRRLVYVALVEAVSNTFRKRWQQEKQRLNESIPGGLQYTTEEWDKEWIMVVNAAEDMRKTTMAYEFLEEMHVFVLANVICRPIIILGESTVRSPLAGDSIEQNNFVGIYLPLLRDSRDCDKNPVILCFLHNHFQPLISRYTFASEPDDLLAVPLVTSRLEPLHIHFLLPDEESMAHDLLQQYLYTHEVPRKSDDGCSDEAILVAEIVYSQRYYRWENSDYALLTEKVRTQVDVQKISQAPSKSSLNYIQSAQGHCPVHKGSHDLYQPKLVTVECSHCGNTHQKSVAADVDGSTSMLGNSSGHKHGSKLQFDISKGTPDKSKNYPDHPKSHTDCAKIHEDLSTGHLDSAGWNTHIHSKQSMNLAGIGLDRRHAAPVAESIPDNVMIFNTLKKLKSPQQTEGASWRTVEPRTPASQSTGPGNSKSSAAAESQIQPQRKLSDISDADVKYIRQKFTHKTPIYCRSLALLGKQCAKPDCNRFLVDEADFCCSAHAYPPNPPPEVVEKPRTLCSCAGCLNLGLARYNGMCAKCFTLFVFGNSLRKEEKGVLISPTGYVRSLINRSTKSPSTHPEHPEVEEPKFKCITEGCNDSVGDAPCTKLVGMCNKCFVQEYTTNFSTTKNSEPSRKMITERAVEQLEQVKCVTDGCKSRGYADYSGLCFECYLQPYFAKGKAETKRAVVAKCTTKGCYGFGYSDYFGLCTRCYIKASFVGYGILDGSGNITVVESAKNEPSSSKSDQHLESEIQKELPQSNTQPPRSAATEGTEPDEIHWVHKKSEKQSPRAIEKSFDDWYEKKYPSKVLVDGTFMSESPISGVLPFRNTSIAQDREELETEARNNCTKNKQSFQGGDEEIAVGKDNGESSSTKNALERSTIKGNAEVSKDDLPPLITVESLRQNNGSEKHGELSSDDPVSVDAILLHLPKSDDGLWPLPSSAPDLVASGSECSDGEEFLKCLSAKCKHVAMDTVAGGYCVGCHATRSRTDGQMISEVAEGVSDQPVKMPTQAPANRALQPSQQNPVGSAKRGVMKAEETSDSSLTCSGLTRTATACLRPSCDRYGDPVYQGYCSQCATQFENSTMEIDSC